MEGGGRGWKGVTEIVLENRKNTNRALADVILHVHTVHLQHVIRKVERLKTPLLPQQHDQGATRPVQTLTKEFSGGMERGERRWKGGKGGGSDGEVEAVEVMEEWRRWWWNERDGEGVVKEVKV